MSRPLYYLIAELMPRDPAAKGGRPQRPAPIRLRELMKFAKRYCGLALLKLPLPVRIVREATDGKAESRQLQLRGQRPAQKIQDDAA